MRYRLLHKRLPAGMMGMVVAVALVMALLCFAMILAAYYYQLGFSREQVQQRLQRNAVSGIHYLLAAKASEGHSQVLDLFGAQEDSVRLQSGPWGAFSWAASTAFHQQQAYSQQALFAVAAGAEDEYALYLSDERRPLSLAGDTRIEGKAYLPKSGIRSAYVGRVGYRGSQLVYGERAISQSSLPPLNTQVLESIQQLQKGEFNGPANRPSSSSSPHRPRSSPEYLPELPDLFQRSFRDRTAVYVDSSAFEVRQELKGKIILYSTEQITVRRQAKLEDVLLVAPKILLEAGFKGSVQAIARDTILVGSACELSYPSALVVWSGQPEALLDMEEGSQLEGVAVVGGPGGYKKKLMRLGKESVLTGGIYADAFADLKGTVKGGVACRKFLLQTPATLYENHLFHATLSWEQLPKAFAGSPLWWDEKEKVIAKWVD